MKTSRVRVIDLWPGRSVPCQSSAGECRRSSFVVNLPWNAETRAPCRAFRVHRSEETVIVRACLHPFAADGHARAIGEADCNSGWFIAAIHSIRYAARAKTRVLTAPLQRQILSSMLHAFLYHSTQPLQIRSKP